VRVLGLIPARGGSKGIRNKNIVALAGRPLIAWTVAAVRSSSLLDDCIVSTDSKEIAAAAVAAGAAAPFLRPPELAAADSTAQQVVAHALKAYDPGGSFDYVMLLQPTSPLRNAGDIDGAIGLARRHDAASVVSFTYEETHHPYYMYFVEAAGVPDGPPRMKQIFDYRVGTPRQDFPPAAYRNGAVYLTRTEYFRREASLVSEDVVPWFMPPSRSINIDTPEPAVPEALREPARPPDGTRGFFTAGPQHPSAGRFRSPSLRG
jgi:CMP-N-acetylneuraminic acid synthetase